MGKCPKCGAEIDELIAYSLEENKQTIWLTGMHSEHIVDPQLDWSESDPVENSCIRIDFECPECGKVIFSNKGDSNDPEIIKFLKGETCLKKKKQ